MWKAPSARGDFIRDFIMHTGIIIGRVEGSIQGLPRLVLGYTGVGGVWKAPSARGDFIRELGISLWILLWIAGGLRGGWLPRTAKASIRI